jgi:hypothetical protein
VFSQPIFAKMTYWGTSSTCEGSIIVPSMSANMPLRPRKSRREKAYAAMLQEMRLPTIVRTQSSSELSM